ncbi:MAG: tetratricopeptide repeat protein [Candidatus Kryptoniota bacterium]
MKSASVLAAFLFMHSFSIPSLQEMLKMSDDLFNKFDNKGACEVLLDANRDYPHDAEILWRLCRVEMHIADHMVVSNDQEKDAQLQAYQIAYDYGDSAVAADPKNSMAYTFRAAVNGKIALFKGVFSVAPIVKQVRDDCEKAISLDPNNPIAYYIMGRTHAKLAEKPSIFRWPLGLSWGNIDDAIKLYQKAISLDPNFIMFRLDLAKSYLSDDDQQKAREQLNAIPSIPKRDEDDDARKAEAGSLLQKIGS